MNNDYKWETVGRCKFYTDGTTCTDIEVMDDTKEISFIYPKIMINRERCQKVFSSVEVMLIGRNVISIVIPNKMFPNIKHVESKSSSFINGKYLIERAGGKLLNVFGQSEDAEIDFTLFNRIGSYAFEGCRATKVSDSEDTGFIRINNNAFFGSGFMNQPFVNGIKCVGSLVVDVDETADEVIMPKTVIQYFPDKFVKCMRLPNIRCIDEVTKKPRKVIIEDKNISHDNEVLFRLHEPGIEEFESRIPRYKTVDGILYSADMKTLVLCPKEKTGEVIIPDGVTRIRRQAFCLTKISRVVFPDSLEKIEAEAFYGCENLEDIDFGHGLERIGENGCKNMFAGCAISKLVLPPQIKKIGIAAFYCCSKLTELVLNEGLEEIGACAFVYCNRLTQITIPKSIKKIGKSAFIWHITQDGVYADINVQISSIPKDFIFGFVEQDVSSDAGTNICVHLKNQTEDFKFILPDAIRSNSNYSKMNFALNDFANHPESSKKVLNEGFLMASTAKSVDITAYKTYKLTKSQRAKEFIRDNSDDIAFSFARMMPEKDFVDFVKLDFVKLKYSERLAEQLRKNEWTTGMAYMLEATEADEKSERKNFVI